MKQDDQGFDPKDLIREKERLSELPYPDAAAPHDEHGVLRSDRIDYYSKNFDLISPVRSQ